MRPTIDIRAEDLERLTRRFRPALIAFFLRRLRNHAEAEDLTQEVFLRLARSDKSNEEMRDAFIFQVAANLLRDRARREKVRQSYREAASQEDGFGVDVLDPSRVAADRESLSVLKQGLRDLPEKTRNIFIQYRLENVDKRTIAEAYDLSESSVNRHLAIAMTFLTQKVRGGDQ